MAYERKSRLIANLPSRTQASSMSRRRFLTLLLATVLTLFLLLAHIQNQNAQQTQIRQQERQNLEAQLTPSESISSTAISPDKPISLPAHPLVEEYAEGFPVEPIHPTTLAGTHIAPPLGNATAKAALGRSAWHLLHTMMSRFPLKPTRDEQDALFAYIHLFARLYPCGECAGHFQELLKKYPPQVGGRMAAAGWACHVHNKVNESLGKEIFDCAKIGDWYDCGCAEEKDGGAEGETNAEKESGKGQKNVDAQFGLSEESRPKKETKGGKAVDESESIPELKLEKEGKTLGG